MRRKANTFLDSEQESPKSECNCCLCKAESRPMKRAQSLDYSPQSSFLKNLKKRSQVLQNLISECDCCQCSKPLRVGSNEADFENDFEAAPHLCPCKVISCAITINVYLEHFKLNYILSVLEVKRKYYVSYHIFLFYFRVLSVESLNKKCKESHLPKQWEIESLLAVVESWGMNLIVIVMESIIF